MNSHQRRILRRNKPLLLAQKLKAFLTQDFGKADWTTLPGHIQNLIPRQEHLPLGGYPAMWDIQSMRDYVRKELGQQ